MVITSNAASAHHFLAAAATAILDRMGRTGFAITLQRDAGAAPLRALRAAVLDVLRDQWNDLLDDREAEDARDWVSAGESSLLCIGDSDANDDAPADALMFWFYSIDWPRERAQHYLNGALVAGRGALTDKLKAIGYRIADAHYPTRVSVLKEHERLLGAETRRPLAQTDCPICRRFGDRDKYGDPVAIPVVSPPTERRRELEKLRIQIHHAEMIAANVSMWQDRAGSYSPPEEHAAMEAELAKATRQRAAAKTEFDALFARTREETPAEIEAWALAHEAILCLFLNDCAERGESDSMSTWSAARDVEAWGALRAGAATWVSERLSSISLGRDRFRSLFGIDPQTLEAVENPIPIAT